MILCFIAKLSGGHQFKKNLRSSIFLKKTLGKLCIPKIKKKGKYQLRRVKMNIDFSEVYIQVSDVKKSNIEKMPVISFVPKSTVDSEYCMAGVLG